MKKYRKESGKKFSAQSGDQGCIKQPSEEKYQMLDNGGGRYSYDNPMELKQRADSLAKMMK